MSDARKNYVGIQASAYNDNNAKQLEKTQSQT